MLASITLIVPPRFTHINISDTYSLEVILIQPHLYVLLHKRCQKTYFQEVAKKELTEMEKKYLCTLEFQGDIFTKVYIFTIYSICDIITMPEKTDFALCIWRLYYSLCNAFRFTGEERCQE